MEHAIETDPGNTELTSLRDELANLIHLTKEYHSATDAKPKPVQETHRYQAGDECMARHHTDDRWYPAKITTVTGSAENPVYSILFTKLKTTDVVSSADLRPRSASQPTSTKGSSSSASRPMTKDELAEERERKRARTEKKREREAAKNREHDMRQSAWQKFQAKAVKKKYGVAGDRSMFKTPDDPYAKSTYDLLTHSRLVRWTRHDQAGTTAQAHIRVVDTHTCI